MLFPFQIEHTFSSLYTVCPPDIGPTLAIFWGMLQVVNFASSIFFLPFRVQKRLPKCHFGKKLKFVNFLGEVTKTGPNQKRTYIQSKYFAIPGTPIL